MITGKKIAIYPDIYRDGIGRYISEINKYLQVDRIKSKYKILSPMQLIFENVNDYDLLHVPNFFVPLRKKSKIVCTIQDIIPILDKSLFRIEQRLYLKFRIYWSLKIADHIIFTSKSTYKDVCKEFKFNNDYSIIPLGVNKPLEKIILPQNQPRKYFLHVGRRRSHKNIINILKAFSSMNLTKYDLIFVGDKDKDDQKIKNISSKLGIDNNIKFTGRVSDSELAGYYTNAISLIYPSLFEGFGLPILEAMSYKCPVITSNKSSMKEISKDSCILIRPENIDELKYAMSSIADDKIKRQRYIEKGINNIKSFSWEMAAKKTLEVYEKVLEVTE